MSINTDNYKETETTPATDYKFCFCFNLEQGYKIIGLLEVVATLW